MLNESKTNHLWYRMWWLWFGAAGRLRVHMWRAGDARQAVCLLRVRARVAARTACCGFGNRCSQQQRTCRWPRAFAAMPCVRVCARAPAPPDKCTDGSGVCMCREPALMFAVHALHSQCACTRPGRTRNLSPGRRLPRGRT